ncbi:MAG: hypothetical protein ACI392_06810 [Paludibacteraceae bacterium]
MRYRFAKLIIGVIVVCCLTGCPEGFMSEGITDEMCQHNLVGTTWTTPCHDSEIILSFISCDIWTATLDTLQISGFYTGDANSVIGSVFAGEQLDSTFCCIGNTKTFAGDIEDEQLVIDDCHFVKQR